MCKRSEKQWENFSYLTKSDIEQSFHQLFLISQIESYLSKYSGLLQGKKACSQNKILNRTPIFNKNLIKVSGYLYSAEISMKNKHKIVVSKTHPIAILIIQEIHQRNLYTGREQTSFNPQRKILDTILQVNYKKIDTWLFILQTSKMLNLIIRLWETYHLIETKWEKNVFKCWSWLFPTNYS